MHRTGLYWFTHDLRLHDNSALAAAAEQCEHLVFVYVKEHSLFQPTSYQHAYYQKKNLGAARRQFLQQGLEELAQQLANFGHPLLILDGTAQSALSVLIEKFHIDAVFLSQQFGFYERQAVEQLQQLNDISINEIATFSLFSAEQIDSLKLSWPMSFSKFRRKVRGLEVCAAQSFSSLPKALLKNSTVNSETVCNPNDLSLKLEFQAGEQAAHRHWQSYKASRAIYHYKQTRNAIDEWSASTKLSPWLNQGALSAAYIYNQVTELESKIGGSADLEWIRVELLWREFFLWLGRWQGVQLFSFEGLRKQPPLTSFYAERFKKWCEGETPWPIVNAIMKQLVQTGFISNRARQIAASCLVNELSIDWRYGAAWFEQHLIDYEVSANWGNWQYIAGVGVDPRGGRHFNLTKQSEMFDPEGDYVRRWHGETAVAELDVLDAAGWPIAYGK